MNPNTSRLVVAATEVRLLRRPSPPRSYTLILLGLLAFTAAVTVLLFHLRSEISASAPPAIARRSSHNTLLQEPVPSAAAAVPALERAGPGVIARRQTASSASLVAQNPPLAIP